MGRDRAAAKGKAGGGTHTHQDSHTSYYKTTHPITRQLGKLAEAPQHQLDSMALKNPTSNAKALLLLVQPHLGAHLQKGC